MSQKSRLSDVQRFVYRDPQALDQALFWKMKAKVHGDATRSKTFWYVTPDPEKRGLYAYQQGIVGYPKETGPGALFQIQGIQMAIKYALPIVLWTEGEKDALSARVYGVPAVSHHGGAGKATIEQAAHFAGYKGTVGVVADRDDPGMYCALKRLELLTDVGVTAQIVRAASSVTAGNFCPADRPCECDVICPTPEKSWVGADLADHITQGHGITELETPGARELTEARDRWQERMGAGYSYVPALEEWEREMIAGSQLIKHGWGALTK